MKYDVVILGAGTAGLSARSEVEKVTDNYLVIDGGELGTTCARVGCMPSKSLIEAAHIFHQSSKFEAIGVSGAESLKISYPALMNHIRGLRDHFVNGVLSNSEKWMKNHFLKGFAKFLDPHCVQVGDRKIEGKKFVIATGSRPIIPPQWQAFQKHLITSDHFFEMQTLSPNIAVIGGGAIGLELAQALAQLKIEISLFADPDSLGGLTDPDFRKIIVSKLEKDLRLIPHRVTDLIHVEASKFKIEAGGKTYDADQVLLAIGREPNLKDLNLIAAGIAVDERGIPSFDPETCRIPGTSVYIAGDCDSRLAVLHEAADEGRIAGYNSVRDEDCVFKRHTPLVIAFSNPHTAIVGSSFKELNEKKVDFVSGSVDFSDQGRSRTKLENHGLLKVYGDRRSGEILGAEIFAPDGEHLAHILAFAIEAKTTVFEMLTRPFYHPTVEEGLRTALRELGKKTDAKEPEAEIIRCQDPPVI